MAKFTLLEVHLDESTFTANAPFSGEAEEEAEPTDAEGGSSPAAVIGALVGLLFLAIVALAVKRKLSGQDDDEFAEGEEVELEDIGA